MILLNVFLNGEAAPGGNNLPGEAALSRGRSVFKKRKRKREKRRKSEKRKRKREKGKKIAGVLRSLRPKKIKIRKNFICTEKIKIA